MVSGLSYYGVREIAVAFSPLEVGAPISMASTPYWLDLSMSGSIYAFVGALCLFTTLAFGLVPALHVSRTDPHDTLKEGGRTIGGVRARRWTTALMVAELALTLILLSVAGLLWRSFITQYRADTVLDPTGVVTMQFSLPRPDVSAGRSSDSSSCKRCDERLRGMPAVKSIALSKLPPVPESEWHGNWLSTGKPLLRTGIRRLQPRDLRDRALFRTLGLSHVTGPHWSRGLMPNQGAKRVVVSQRFVDMFFPRARRRSTNSAQRARRRLPSRPG